jgi:acyl-CoA thioesterase FadM
MNASTPFFGAVLVDGNVELDIPVRGYELDRDGQVPPAVWLRHFEHMRWEAHRCGAPQLQGLFQEGNAAVVVAQRLRIMPEAATAGVGTVVRATLWIRRVGRTSVDIEHVLRHGESGAIVAQGGITAVHVGPDRRPTPIPDPLRELVTDGDAAPIELPPPPDAVPDAAFSARRRIGVSELDFLRHVNQSNYAVFFEDARWRAAAEGALGDGPLSRSRLETLHLAYAHEAVLHDEVEAKIWATGDTTAGCALVRVADGRVLCWAALNVQPREITNLPALDESAPRD